MYQERVSVLQKVGWQLYCSVKKGVVDTLMRNLFCQQDNSAANSKTERFQKEIMTTSSDERGFENAANMLDKLHPQPYLDELSCAH